MIFDQFSLKGKTALVTGCSRGIGKAMAAALAEAGADIIGVSATIPEDGGETGKIIRSLNRNFISYACDLTSRDAINEMLNIIDIKFPPIDILINNAGTIDEARLKNILMNTGTLLWPSMLQPPLFLQGK